MRANRAVSAHYNCAQKRRPCSHIRVVSHAGIKTRAATVETTLAKRYVLKKPHVTTKLRPLTKYNARWMFDQKATLGATTGHEVGPDKRYSPDSNYSRKSMSSARNEDLLGS